jgi:hypothetical protein
MNNRLLTRILLIGGLVPFLVLFFPQLNHSPQAHLNPTDDALYGRYFIVTSNSTHSDGTGWPEHHCPISAPSSPALGVLIYAPEQHSWFPFRGPDLSSPLPPGAPSPEAFLVIPRAVDAPARVPSAFPFSALAAPLIPAFMPPNFPVDSGRQPRWNMARGGAYKTLPPGLSNYTSTGDYGLPGGRWWPGRGPGAPPEPPGPPA